MIRELQIDCADTGRIPDNGSAFVRVTDMHASVDQSILKARAAFASHRTKPIRERLRIVASFRSRLAAQAATVARKLSPEAQRPPEELLASEIIPLLDACRFLEKSAIQLLRPRTYSSRSMPIWLAGTHHQIIREPLGVVLVIGPSNYPLFLPGVQLLQAFVAGNAVLLKPAPTAGESASTLLNILVAAGAPPDLVQCLPSERDSAVHAIGRKVDKVFFTGSAETGRKVLVHAAAALTPAVMELSGSDGTFVLPDADVNLAARSVAFGLTFNSGRTCIAPRRAFVWKQVLGEFSARLKSELRSRPRIVTKQTSNSEFIAKILDAVSKGANVLHGSVGVNGVIEGPLVLTNLTADLPFAVAENWGANLSIIPVSTEQEALRAYDVSPFALGASVFTRNRRAAHRIARAIQAGSVCINDLIVPTADGRLPFSGRKESGFGATRGSEGLLEMTVPKVVSTRRGGTPTHLRPPVGNQFQLLSAYCGLAYGAGRNRWRAFRALLRSMFRATECAQLKDNQ